VDAGYTSYSAVWLGGAGAVPPHPATSGDVRLFDARSAKLAISDISPVSIYQRNTRLTVGDVTPLSLRDMVSAKAQVWDEVSA
jgi:hypothetical protein